MSLLRTHDNSLNLGSTLVLLLSCYCYKPPVIHINTPFFWVAAIEDFVAHYEVGFANKKHQAMCKNWNIYCKVQVLRRHNVGCTLA